MKKMFLFSTFCVFIMGCGANSSTISFNDIKLDEKTQKLVEDMKKAGEGAKGFENIQNKMGYENGLKLTKKLMLLTPNYTSILNLNDPKKVEKDLEKEEDEISKNCNSVDDMLDWMSKDAYRMKVAEVNGWVRDLCWNRMPIVKNEEENKKICDAVLKKPLAEIFKDYPEAKKARDEYFKNMDAKGAVSAPF